MVHPANGSRQAGDGAPAAKAVTFDQGHFQALPSRRDRRGHSGSTPANDQHVGLDGGSFTTIHYRVIAHDALSFPDEAR